MAELLGLAEVVSSEFRFQAADGYELGGRHFAVPEGHARAGAPILACLHGIQSHSGWYSASSAAFARAGYETYFLDRRGSGINQVDRGHTTGVFQLRDDVYRFIEVIRERHNGRPVVLLGISWGGKLALAAIRKRPELVDGLIFVCPGWYAKVSPTLWEKVIIATNFYTRPRRLIKIPLSDPKLFTDNPEKQEFIRNDPLALRQGTTRLLLTSRVMDSIIDAAPRLVRVPSLLLLAGEDRIIDNPRVRVKFEQFASLQKKVIEFPGFHHTLEFEPDPTPYFRAVIEWLEATFVNKG